MDSIAVLILKIQVDKDNLGQPIYETSERTIFVTEKSVSRSEFFNAGTMGLYPEYVLETAAINYNGETEAVYNNIKYAIYRTYRRDDIIELYLQKEVGV